MSDQQVLHDSGESSWEQAFAKAKDVVQRLDNVTLNIAVTGETGSGKSSFVNAIRSVRDTDEEAASTGVTETTMEPTRYRHKHMPNVNIWDLPGIGGIQFNEKTYLKDVKYQNYDFFIIVSSSRFMKNDIMLAKEIEKKKKKFYFVRSKTDEDVRNEKERKGIREELTLQKIRDNCLENLSTLGSPPVFLITSHNLERFDFQKLVNTLANDLPDHKRDALVMSLPVHCKESLDNKFNTFKEAAWAVAFVSGGIAAIPVPGLSTACDVVMVVGFLTKCYYSFGLDDGSLKTLSERVGKDILGEVKKSALVRAMATKKSLVANVAGRLGVAGAIEALCLLVPVAGSIAAAGISIGTTRFVLLEGLKELYRVAERVLVMAELH